MQRPFDSSPSRSVTRSALSSPGSTAKRGSHTTSDRPGSRRTPPSENEHPGPSFISQAPQDQSYPSPSTTQMDIGFSIADPRHETPWPWCANVSPPRSSPWMETPSNSLRSYDSLNPQYDQIARQTLPTTNHPFSSNERLVVPDMSCNTVEWTSNLYPTRPRLNRSQSDLSWAPSTAGDHHWNDGNPNGFGSRISSSSASVERNIASSDISSHSLWPHARSTEPLEQNLGMDSPAPSSGHGRTRIPWSASEDQTLLRIVAEMKEIYDEPLPWSKVAASFNNRTAAMCSKRHQTLTSSSDSDKGSGFTHGAWTKEEDEDLLRVYAAYTRDPTAPIPWTRIGSLLRKPRTGLQTAARYTEALDSSVRRGRWTKEEDAILQEQWQLLGPRWSIICHSIPGRTQRQCASRFTILQKWAAKVVDS